ncbi:uncharacterized protein SETTUDRAFT_163328 [Exserohilum turcica Et28A]|uniref:Uncharacterized protein n=1 Tax=Exserohilum turcicum (strain 28A) TaxID=671987 RepID=R0IRP5_EXST2|nr:uncharacterized protein SETTUDRAFT_163328 [Exserohilum turcica Et28A]EOA87366.1 hypothetical protein SETTUDRAFT_163328 [Exserohilum turcica Et28A]
MAALRSLTRLVGECEREHASGSTGAKSEASIVPGKHHVLVSRANAEDYVPVWHYPS